MEQVVVVVGENISVVGETREWAKFVQKLK